MPSRRCSRRSALAAAAASALGASSASAQAKRGGEYGDLKDVTLQGRLSSLGGLLGRKYGARVAGAAGKQWGLVLPEGQIYTFLDGEGSRKLLAAGLAEEAVEVQPASSRAPCCWR